MGITSQPFICHWNGAAKFRCFQKRRKLSNIWKYYFFFVKLSKTLFKCSKWMNWRVWTPTRPIWTKFFQLICHINLHSFLLKKSEKKIWDSNFWIFLERKIRSKSLYLFTTFSRFSPINYKLRSELGTRKFFQTFESFQF